MKKVLLLAAVCALFAVKANAQQQEIQYVEDPSQGYLFNKFSDNWFITGQGGVGVYFSHGDGSRDLKDRFAPAAGLYVGKWFSPIIGARLGAEFLTCKGLSEINYWGREDEPMIDGMYKQKFNEVGPALDVMLSLTNWWCGYHPGRKYNCVLYAGGGGYWSFSRDYENGERGSWKYNHDRVLTWRAGLINSVALGRAFELSLDLRFSCMDAHQDYEYIMNRTAYDVQAYLGLTYKFPKREWSAPIVPICPEPENCDALRARLQAADARIADLEAQLRDCLNKPASTVVEEKDAPLATIYYPCNVSKLTAHDVEILGAVSQVMKENPAKTYTLTGWADNYTGNDQINTRLRKARVAGVEQQLLKLGVPQAQLTSTINDGNLCDLGEKYVALDRAVTIEEN